MTNIIGRLFDGAGPKFGAAAQAGGAPVSQSQATQAMFKPGGVTQTPGVAPNSAAVDAMLAKASAVTQAAGTTGVWGVPYYESVPAAKTVQQVPGGVPAQSATAAMLYKPAAATQIAGTLPQATTTAMFGKPAAAAQTAGTLPPGAAYLNPLNNKPASQQQRPGSAANQASSGIRLSANGNDVWGYKPNKPANAFDSGGGLTQPVVELEGGGTQPFVDNPVTGFTQPVVDLEGGVPQPAIGSAKATNVSQVGGAAPVAIDLPAAPTQQPWSISSAWNALMGTAPQNTAPPAPALQTPIPVPLAVGQQSQPQQQPVIAQPAATATRQRPAKRVSFNLDRNTTQPAEVRAAEAQSQALAEQQQVIRLAGALPASPSDAMLQPIAAAQQAALRDQQEAVGFQQQAMARFSPGVAQQQQLQQGLDAELQRLQQLDAERTNLLKEYEKRQQALLTEKAAIEARENQLAQAVNQQRLVEARQRAETAQAEAATLAQAAAQATAAYQQQLAATQQAAQPQGLGLNESLRLAMAQSTPAVTQPFNGAQQTIAQQPQQFSTPATLYPPQQPQPMPQQTYMPGVVMPSQQQQQQWQSAYQQQQPIYQQQQQPIYQQQQQPVYQQQQQQQQGSVARRTSVGVVVGPEDEAAIDSFIRNSASLCAANGMSVQQLTMLVRAYVENMRTLRQPPFKMTAGQLEGIIGVMEREGVLPGHLRPSVYRAAGLKFTPATGPTPRKGRTSTSRGVLPSLTYELAEVDCASLPTLVSVLAMIIETRSKQTGQNVAVAVNVRNKPNVEEIEGLLAQGPAGWARLGIPNGYINPAQDNQVIGELLGAARCALNTEQKRTAFVRAATNFLVLARNPTMTGTTLRNVVQSLVAQGVIPPSSLSDTVSGTGRGGGQRPMPSSQIVDYVSKGQEKKAYGLLWSVLDAYCSDPRAIVEINRTMINVLYSVQQNQQAKAGRRRRFSTSMNPV